MTKSSPFKFKPKKNLKYLFNKYMLILVYIVFKNYFLE